MNVFLKGTKRENECSYAIERERKKIINREDKKKKECYNAKEKKKQRNKERK